MNHLTTKLHSGLHSRLKRPTHPKVAGFRHLICTQPHWSSVWDASFPYLGWTRPEPLSGPLRSWWMHLMQCSGFVALTPIDIPRIHRLPFVVLPLQGGPLGTKHLRALCASLGEDCLPTSTVLRRATVQGLSPPTAEHHPSPRGLVSNPWQRALDCLVRHLTVPTKVGLTTRARLETYRLVSA